MNPTPVQIAIRTLLAIVASFLVVFACVKVYQFAYNRGYEKGGIAMRDEIQAKAEHRVEANKQEAQSVVKQHKSQSAKRSAYVKKTEPEVDHATKDLSSCPVPAPAVKLWNEASSCLLDASATGCGTD